MRPVREFDILIYLVLGCACLQDANYIEFVRKKHFQFIQKRNHTSFTVFSCIPTEEAEKVKPGYGVQISYAIIFVQYHNVDLNLFGLIRVQYLCNS